MTESPRRNLYRRLSAGNHRKFQNRPFLHLADEPILVDGPARLAVGKLGLLSPHLLDVLQDHVAMPVEGLHTSEELAVVAARNQDLRVRTHSRLKERKRAGREFMLLELGDLILAVLELSAGRNVVGCARATGCDREDVRQLVAGLVHKLPGNFVSISTNERR